VLATGLKPENKLYESLVSEIADLYAVGDCVEPRNILDAIWDGFVIGNTI
jgi:2-enoate reductase